MISSAAKFVSEWKHINGIPSSMRYIHKSRKHGTHRTLAFRWKNGQRNGGSAWSAFTNYPNYGAPRIIPQDSRTFEIVVLDDLGVDGVVINPYYSAPDVVLPCIESNISTGYRTGDIIYKCPFIVSDPAIKLSMDTIPKWYGDLRLRLPLGITPLHRDIVTLEKILPELLDTEVKSLYVSMLSDMKFQAQTLQEDTV